MDHSVEVVRLRATVRDLLALSAIPEVWVGREPPALATELADLLIESLHLDFAFVRLCDPEMRQTVEAIRGDAWNTFPEWLQQRLAVSGISRKEVVTQICGPEESCCGIVIPVGVNGERGLVAAAWYRSDFPDQTDQQLLSVAANSAATAFRNAHLINELRNAQKELRHREQELRTARDELEIKVAERTSELSASEAKYRYLVDTTPAFVHTALANGDVDFYNRGWLEYVGIPLTDLLGWGWGCMIHPEDVETIVPKWRAALEAGEPFIGESRVRRADGEYRWFLHREEPLRNETGEIVKWYGSSIEIEERKIAEEKIREQEAELRQILDLTPQHIAVLAPDGSRLYVNHTALEYFGITLEQWRDPKAYIEHAHPEDREHFLAERKKQFLEGKPHEFEARLLRRDGEFRWFLFRLTPLKDEHGHITRWYATATDIEDRKRAEEEIRKENIALREEIIKASMFEEIVGNSPALQQVLVRVTKVAPTDSTVLITGETGTGKELIARAIHKASKRSDRAFVSVNCAAIPQSLIPSELFGHEKGAFTGATGRRLGRFELAEGGTIFLDEVGELPPETQVALLRVLQEREFEHVGGNKSIKTNVRVIVATNRDLQACIAAGTFREDLFYRLNVFPVEIPPLRKRKEDIPLLVQYFIDRYAREAGKNIRTVGKETLDLFQSYPWPGNIRELRNVIERSVIVCETESFSVDESWLSRQPLRTSPTSQHELRQRVAAEERQAIEAALTESRGQVFGPSGAAARLGIARSTLESKIKTLQIDKNRFKVSNPS